ncbi:sulfotransferase [Vibrio owensii]|uniref:Sulfotransferase n=1 Tax=Vibrio owensii TaxID=696485 RepID=A0AAP9KCI3_9VIBR|nr:sulfotransferase [Vibrio owensii]AYO17489.1 sulfotransferase [Vibrio owensii]QGH49631.1 hypothetical protein APZ19_21290 [Vibrio owensii]
MLKKHLVPLPIIKFFGYANIFKRILINKWKFDSKDELISPFFIVGCGRSGNTLLRRVLCSTNEVTIPPESYMIPRIIKLYTIYNWMEWEQLVSIVVGEFTSYKEFHTWNLNTNEVIFEARSLNVKNRNLAGIIDVIYKNYARSNKTKEYWGDKTPINSLYIDKILKIYPNAKFIHLVRNPLDTTLSYVNCGLKENYKDAALFWKDSNLAVEKIKSRKKESFVTVYYEDFVTNPKENLRKICSHIGIRYSDEMLLRNTLKIRGDDTTLHAHHENVHSDINQKSVGKWKKHISIIEANEIERLSGLRTIFNKYNYKNDL